MSRILFFLLFLSCTKAQTTVTNPPDSDYFAKGADIGWLSEMESKGIKFYNNNGQEQDCIDILKGLGMNTLRFRVWVNPVNGWCGQEDVVKQAIRASKKGMRIMIDFHYSDYWADPGKQNKPEKWKNISFALLNDSLRNHTLSVLKALKNNNVTPEWVQVGNETNDGMLWEEGRASKNMTQFAALVKTGYGAVKEVFPGTKVIVHISNGYDNGLFKWIFDGLKNNGATWDVTGMSLYPSVSDWQTKTDQCIFNMYDMINRYGKEVSMPADQPQACKSFITDLITKSRALANKKGLGVLYWEPQAYNNWQGYGLGAWTTDGKPSAALEAFKN
jgi:arabinogalactan endo-1,4-beta-galactosidase